MLDKIARDICLIKYRKFPLRDFEKDEEIYFYPEIYSRNWFELEHKSNVGLIKILSAELPKLYKNLKVENLIFFGDYNRNWISKFTEERQDFKPLIDAVDYFKHHKVGKSFNGAVKVSIAELPEFVKHFFILATCDGGFAYYHFLDEKENLLGFIHYSGEVRFDILNQKIEKRFVEEIKKTKFIPKE